jgi:tetratricopeptide (TPR) repeat protein
MTADLLTAGWRYHQAGDLARAELAYRQVLQQQPANAEVWNLLACILGQQRRLAEAVACCQRALQLRPDFADAYHTLGAALAGLGRTDEALASLHQAVRLRPEFAEAHNLLGKVFRDRQRPAEAEACFRATVRIRPDFGEAHYNLAVALLQQRRPAEAEAPCREAVRLLPGLAATHNSLGAVLLELDRLLEASASFQRAVQLNPGSAEAHNNLGNVLRDLGRFDEALARYAEALRLQPEHAEVHWNVALVRLLLGQFDEGWSEYEWLWRRPEFSSRTFAQPRWDGSSLAGRTILLYADHGLGDTIQFMRYARLVQEQGARVIVECPGLLLRLLHGCPGIDQLVAQGEPLPPHDVCAPLLSLPRRFGTRLETIPATVPYLEADATLVEAWRRHLAPLGGFKIGITWQGNPQHVNDRQRSIPLQEFASLAQLPGLRLVSLQHGPAGEQLTDVAGKWPVTDLGGRLDEVAGAFMDRAAVMRSLDLVVTCDTSIAHLAGALGVPVWVALPQVPDWRWLLERDDSPWYPTMRLFRQEHRGEWGPVFQRITQAVRQRVAAESQASARGFSPTSPKR